MSGYLRLFILFLFFSASVEAQFNLNSSDLSNVKISSLTDEELRSFQQQAKSMGLTEAQAEQLAVSRRLPATELVALRKRLVSLQGSTSTPSNGTASRTYTATEVATSASAAMLSPISTVFGSELFGTTSLSFQPDLKIATPVNYELGPDDELLISVYGVQEASFALTVSPEGSIYIPNVGLIRVAGETVEAASSRIKNKMASIAYGTLRTGASKLSVTLGRIRSIRVTVLGAVKPGTYTVSSLSTLFNVLYLAGGPSAIGSFREIELLRGNKVERKIDLYNFLLKGDQQDNVRLRENDVVRIPPYNKRVELAGEVRRQGFYELLQKETFNILLQYASGFTDNAYRASVKVQQITPRDRRVLDLDANQYPNYIPGSGDVIEVARVLDRYQNRVAVAGAVLRPGTFELVDGLTIGGLIRKADGLREDAFAERGHVKRLKEDLSVEIIPFNVMNVMKGINDLPLKREDEVTISSIFELRDQFSVTVQGEVRNPGAFQYSDSLTLKSLLFKAGGFSDAAFPQRIEIARRIRRDTLTATDARLSEIIEITDVTDFSFDQHDITLYPYDVVTVRRMPGYLQLESVSAVGQVQYPGPYVIANRMERVSDLLRRAGGLSPEAYADGAYLVRHNPGNLVRSVEAAKVEKIQRQMKDTTGTVTSSINRPYDLIPLDLSQIISKPGNAYDLLLKPGDELFVPRNDEEISVTGEILFPTKVPYAPNKSLKEYISDAGGFADNARKSKAYVLYANGKAATTRRFLFFKNYPEVKPGSQIIIPHTVEKVPSRRTTAETVGLASAFASLAGVVIAILNSTR
ncbi:SLBB domain-containing protein [Aridibaculum aurantiacum]|uniref:SLBB domain-containing protein n=1 Tax=Aridibaculum aurantiacum TaxID=2810307 RepID=UPI001A968818|nr:SLBB domain-containing protein [Aridibaculum aurantiacum]